LKHLGIFKLSNLLNFIITHVKEEFLKFITTLTLLLRVFSKNNLTCSRDYLTIAFRTRGHVVSSLPNARLESAFVRYSAKSARVSCGRSYPSSLWNPSRSVSEGSRRARFPFTRARAYALSSGTQSGLASAYLRHLANIYTRECESSVYARGTAWVSIKIIIADGGAFLSDIGNRFTVARLPASRSVCARVSFSQPRHRAGTRSPEPVIIIDS